jgi:origin recognition complex subunit 2
MYEEDRDTSDTSPSDEEHYAPTGHVGRNANAVANNQLIQKTTFDLYFLTSSKSAKTSSNVFTNLVAPLTNDEYASAIQPILTRSSSVELCVSDKEFAQYTRELDAGFNLVFYGLGSKRIALNAFARDCFRRGHVVVAHAFRPQFALKDLLASIERVPGVLDFPLPTSGIEGQAQRVRMFFSKPSTRGRALYLIIHNIDAHPLRTARARACLSLLALAPRIHIVASVDHISAPILFSTSESSTRKSDDKVESDDVSTRGYNWLWHDLTTLEPYDIELSYANRSSISGASATTAKAQQDATVATPGRAGALSETAALHVLASVTAKAKKLFVMMSERQLDAMNEAVELSSELQKFAVGYDVLFNLARDNFIATTDGALRALLGEFRDHGLVLSAVTGGVGGREVLWIPLRKERIGKILQASKAD